MTSVDDLIERYNRALTAQAEANAAESAAIDNAKIAFSKAVLAAGDVAVAKSEHIARASEAYGVAIGQLDDARLAAETTRAEVEYVKTRFEAWRTKTSMAKARLTNG